MEGLPEGAPVRGVGQGGRAWIQPVAGVADTGNPVPFQESEAVEGNGRAALARYCAAPKYE